MARVIDSHLPPGREPGPQSMRGASQDDGSGALLPIMAILFLACFIGLPLAVVSLTDAQGVIYPTLGALALVFVVAMWVLVRRLRSGPAPATESFEIVGEPLELRRGGELEAELTIYEPGEVGSRLEVGIVCLERYDHPAHRGEGSGEFERAIGEDVAYERWLSARRTDERQIFRFRIPLDAPYSYEGECLSFAWRVTARDRAEEGGGTSDDPVWVLP